jgi:hypothetical protein
VDPSETTAVAVKAHHFVQIDASPDTLSITAIDKDSQVIDQLELTTLSWISPSVVRRLS